MLQRCNRRTQNSGICSHLLRPLNIPCKQASVYILLLSLVLSKKQVVLKARNIDDVHGEYTFHKMNAVISDFWIRSVSKASRVGGIIGPSKLCTEGTIGYSQLGFARYQRSPMMLQLEPGRNQQYIPMLREDSMIVSFAACPSVLCIHLVVLCTCSSKVIIFFRSALFNFQAAPGAGPEY